MLKHLTELSIAIITATVMIATADTCTDTSKNTLGKSGIRVSNKSKNIS